MGNSNKNRMKRHLTGYAGVLQREMAALTGGDQVRALADLSRAHSFHYFTEQEVEELLDERALTIQGLYLGMIEIFIVGSAEVRAVSRCELIDDAELRETVSVRVITEQEMAAMAMELQSPTAESREEVRIFAQVLSFYQSIFGEIDWAAVPEFLRTSTLPILEDDRDSMILRVR